MSFITKAKELFPLFTTAVLRRSTNKVDLTCVTDLLTDIDSKKDFYSPLYEKGPSILKMLSAEFGISDVFRYCINDSEDFIPSLTDDELDKLIKIFFTLPYNIITSQRRDITSYSDFLKIITAKECQNNVYCENLIVKHFEVNKKIYNYLVSDKDLILEEYDRVMKHLSSILPTLEKIRSLIDVNPNDVNPNDVKPNGSKPNNVNPVESYTVLSVIQKMKFPGPSFCIYKEMFIAEINMCKSILHDIIHSLGIANGSSSLIEDINSFWKDMKNTTAMQSLEKVNLMIHQKILIINMYHTKLWYLNTIKKIEEHSTEYDDKKFTIDYIRKIIVCVDYVMNSINEFDDVLSIDCVNHIFYFLFVDLIIPSSCVLYWKPNQREINEMPGMNGMLCDVMSTRIKPGFVFDCISSH